MDPKHSEDLGRPFLSFTGAEGPKLPGKNKFMGYSKWERRRKPAGFTEVTVEPVLSDEKFARQRNQWRKDISRKGCPEQGRPKNRGRSQFCGAGVIPLAGSTV